MLFRSCWARGARGAGGEREEEHREKTNHIVNSTQAGGDEQHTKPKQGSLLMNTRWLVLMMHEHTMARTDDA